MDEYAVLIQEAGEAHAAAKADYAVAAGARVEAEGEAAELEAELEALRRRMADFEAGRLLLAADEYVGLADRQRWLEIRIRQQAAIVRQAKQREQAATGGVQAVGAAYRARLSDALRKDAAAREQAARAALEAVLR